MRLDHLLSKENGIYIPSKIVDDLLFSFEGAIPQNERLNKPDCSLKTRLCKNQERNRVIAILDSLF